MSHELLLQPEHETDGLRYREEGLEFLACKQRQRWQVAVEREGVVLGVDVVNLADAKARRALVRALRGADEGERALVERVLVGLAVKLTVDWEEHAAWFVQQHDERLAAVQARDEQAEELARTERAAALDESTKPLLEDPALLFLIAEAVAQQGVVGERRNVLMVYLAIASQHLDTPISLVVKGESSGGKSHLVQTVFRLFPEHCHIDLTSVSERGLIYDTRPYSHRTIVFYEMHGQGNEMVNYLIRTLISEGRITHLTVEKDEQGNMVGKVIDKPGPTNFITTTTSPEGHAENETRVWSILVDESAAATRGVLRLSGEQAAGNIMVPGADAWRDVQEWLSLAGDRHVVIPYAPVLAELVPDEPVRMRRDFKRLMHLLQVSAVLHQRQRSRDSSGRIEASLADYAMVHELVSPAFGRVVRGVSEKTMELVEALAIVLEAKEARGIENPTASYTDLVEVLHYPKYRISRWLQPALQIGLVDNTEETKGKPAALRFGKFEVDQRKALPSPQEIADHLETSFEWVDALSGEARQVTPLHRSTVAEGVGSEEFSPPAASSPWPSDDHPPLHTGGNGDSRDARPRGDRTDDHEPLHRSSVAGGVGEQGFSPSSPRDRWAWDDESETSEDSDQEWGQGDDEWPDDADEDVGDEDRVTEEPMGRKGQAAGQTALWEEVL